MKHDGHFSGGGALLAMLGGVCLTAAGALVALGWWLHGIFH